MFVGNTEKELLLQALTAQVEVTTTSTLLVDADENRRQFLVQNNTGGDVRLWFGEDDDDFTGSNGLLLPDGGLFGEAGYTGAVWATAGGTVDVDVVEFG